MKAQSTICLLHAHAAAVLMSGQDLLWAVEQSVLCNLHIVSGDLDLIR